jgi:hypothetical protein
MAWGVDYRSTNFDEAFPTRAVTISRRLWTRRL